MQLSKKHLPLVISGGINAALVLCAALVLWSLPRHVRHGAPGLHMVGEVLYFGEKPFTGIEEQYYENGDLYKENRYENGILEGVSREYSLGKVLRDIWRFHAGKKHGLQEGWFAEGPKRFEFHFNAGLLDGLQIEWHLNGREFRRQVFVQGIETEKKILYPQAEIFSNYVVRNGRQYGVDGGALCLETKAEGAK